VAPPKRPWFRLYVEVFADPKLRRLTPAQRWLWVVVLGAARQSPTPGVLLITEREPVTIADLAETSGVKLPEAKAGMARMVDLGMVELDDDVYRVAKWSERQYESDDTTERTRKYRRKAVARNGDTPTMERSNGVPGNVDVADQRTETETDVVEVGDKPTSRDSAPGGGCNAPSTALDSAKLNAAAAILANAEADRRGSAIANRAGYVSSRLGKLRAEHEHRWHQILEREPHATPDELARSTVPVSPEDGTVAAQEATFARNAQRQAEPVDVVPPDQAVALARAARRAPRTTEAPDA
jgi:hypothetical protein